VAEHAELAWIFNCIATMGELARMTAYKSKSEGRDSVSVGLFDYPVLQAADVLLYRAERVPVGEDQRQHLELMRDIAIRFNGRYGETFRVPEAAIPRQGARIMDLQQPDRKMSKSDGTELGTIWLLDDPARLKKKVMSAVTDSGSEVRAGEDKPGVTALLEILAIVSDTSVPVLEERFAGQGYGAFKAAVLEALVAYLEPILRRYHELRADPAEAERLLALGAERAHELATPTLALVRDRLGFLPQRLVSPARDSRD
jgi:tryptophanyl-tRNA synthetase